MRTLSLLLVIMLSGCSTLRWPDDFGVTIKDMEGVGNDTLNECQITFNGEVPFVPCVIEVSVEWQI